MIRRHLIGLPLPGSTARRLVALCVLGLAVAAAPLSAQQTQRIAAVVNSEAVSLRDVDERVKMVLFSSGLPDTEDQRKRLVPRIVRTLIDETLQLQEAKRLNLAVTPREIEQATRTLEQRNNIETGKFDNFLRQNGLSRGAIEAQMRAGIAWQKVVARRLTPTVEIGEEEIDQVLERIAAARGQTEIRVSEIVLAVDDPREETETQDLADRLVAQMRGGAAFVSLAAQFSQSASAAVGGDIGWVQSGQLAPELDRVLAAMQQGQLAGPIRVGNLIHILALTGRRQIAAPEAVAGELLLRQFLLPIPTNAAQADIEALSARAAAAARPAASCDDFARVAETLGTPQPPQPARLRPSDLAADLRRAVEGLAVNTPSAPLTSQRGVQVVMVCQRIAPAGDATERSRQEIADQLTRERLDMLARRYLRDLQRVALIEVRI